MNYLDDDGVREQIPLARKGCTDAVEKIFMGNIRLVNKIISDLLGRQVNNDEYMSIAFEAVLVAIDKFDLESDVRFMTYARWWIRQKCMRFARNDRTVRIPTGQLTIMGRISKAIVALRSEDVTITDQMIADKAGLSVKQVRGISYTLVVGTHEETELDVLSCHYEELAHKRISRSEVFDIVREVVSQQPERNREITCRRFGMMGYEKATLQEIAIDLGITRERVRQIAWDVCTKVRRELERHDVSPDEWLTYA